VLLKKTLWVFAHLRSFFQQASERQTGARESGRVIPGEGASHTPSVVQSSPESRTTLNTQHSNTAPPPSMSAAPRARAICREVHEPTAVTHCASVRLTGEANLVLCRQRYIDLYRVINDKLELICSRRLNGTIESLAVIDDPSSASKSSSSSSSASTPSTSSAIVLTFRDAKVSVLRWNERTWDFDTTSLHYFEGDVSLKTGRACFPMPPFCAVDPDGRCAAVIMYRHQMAILPAMKDSSLYPSLIHEDMTENVMTSTAVVGNSYVDNLGLVREVRDAVFLHGTSEPTLLCLHEDSSGFRSTTGISGTPTSITALSINMESKKHPKVWEAVGLPSDAYKVVAAPDGGVLVFTGTAVLYIKQQTKTGVVLHREGLASPGAIPPLEFDPNKEPVSDSVRKFATAYGSALSPKDGDMPPTFCDTTNADWNVDCSCASVAWLESTIALVSFRHGELVTLKLVSERGGSMRLVASKVASGPQPTCMARVGDGLVFVGSRGGDSLLMSWKHLEGVADGDAKSTQDPWPSKKAKVSGAEEDEEVYEEYLEADLLSIFGEADGASSAPSEIEIQVTDSITSLGAMRKLIAAPAGNDHESGAQTFVGCCGTGSNGALAILQRGLAPDIITTIPLPGLRGMWVPSDAYLLLGFEGTDRKHQTKVLSAAADLRELTDDVDFLRDVETVSAGTLEGAGAGSDYLEYQVHRHGIRMLAQGKRVQDLEIEAGVVQATAAGGRLAVATADGGGGLYGVQDGELKLRYQLPTTVHGSPAKVCALDVFQDANGWLTQRLCGGAGTAGTGEDATYVWICYDNGELLVCDVPADDTSGTDSKAPKKGAKAKAKATTKAAGSGKGSEGTVPELEPLWSSNGLASGVNVVARESDDVVSWTPRHVVDIKVACFDNTSHPLLLAVNDAGAVFCYGMFSTRASSSGADTSRNPDPSAGMTPSLSLRLKRLRLSLPVLTSRPSGRRLHAFERIGEDLPYAGFFVTGDEPTWLIVHRGSVYVHESTSALAGSVSSFAPFNNENCPHGFLAATGDGLVIANFAPRMKLDAQWPRRKLGIKSVPIDCAYYPEAKLIVLVVSAAGPRRDFLSEDGESEAQAAYSYALAGLEMSADGRMDSHEVRLVSPTSWKVLWMHQLLPGERSLCVTAVHLKDQTSDATIPMLAIGTSFSAGEDYPCSGRVILVEVVKGNDGAWGGNIVFHREFKGPITNISSVEGYLLLSTGNRLETCILKSAQDKFTLQRSAFFEGPSLITSLNVVKNFILAGDAQHSVQFLRYKDQGKQIMPLAKDFGAACVRSCQFVIAGSSLHIIMADGEGNVRAFTYTPNDPKSWKGQKLDNWGALHVGKGISYMLRAPMQYRADRSSRSSKASGAVCVTDLGGMHVVMPLTQDEATDQALAAIEPLSKALASSVANTAGLNPLAFRRRYQKSLLPLQGATFYDTPPSLFDQGLVDGDLLQSFLQQSTGFQDRLAQQLGIDRDKLAATCRAVRDISIE